MHYSTVPLYEGHQSSECQSWNSNLCLSWLQISCPSSAFYTLSKEDCNWPRIMGTIYIIIWNVGCPRNPDATLLCPGPIAAPCLHLISLILAFFSQKLSQILELNLPREGESFPGLLDTLLINPDDPLLPGASWISSWSRHLPWQHPWTVTPTSALTLQQMQTLHFTSIGHFSLAWGLSVRATWAPWPAREPSKCLVNANCAQQVLEATLWAGRGP